MTSWILSTHNFGLPCVCFVITHREIVFDGLQTELGNHGNDPDKLCEGLTNILLHYRPDLAGGSLVSIESLPMRFRLLYCHPKFAKTSFADQFPEQYLCAEKNLEHTNEFTVHVCPVCEKAIRSDNLKTWRALSKGGGFQDVSLCSEECYREYEHSKLPREGR